MRNQKANSKLPDWKLFLIIASVVITIQIAYFLFVAQYGSSSEERGQFGDMFGALTALFSGLAFAGMISAIALQTKELGLQREELTLTRNVLAESTSAQIELVKMQLLAAQVQGIAPILESYIQAATNNDAQGSRDAANNMYRKASHYTAILEELLTQTGLDLKSKRI